MSLQVDVYPGPLGRMALQAPDLFEQLHGFGIARRMVRIKGDPLAVTPNVLCSILLMLERAAARNARVFAGMAEGRS